LNQLLSQNADWCYLRRTDYFSSDWYNSSWNY